MAEDIWDEYSSRYEKLFMKISFYSKLIEDATLYLKDCDDYILDAGCGTGNLTLSLAKKGKKVVAIDSNPGMIAWTKKKVSENNLTNKVEVLQEDLETRQWETDYYGGVASLNVIFAVKKPFRLLDNMYKCLKSNGRLIIVGPKTIAKSKPMIDVIRKDCYDENMSKRDYEIYEMIQDFVRKVSSSHMNFRSSTRRMEEILLDFVGYDKIEASDIRDKSLETYVGQGFFVVARKGRFSDIIYKQANKKERNKVFKLRYNMLVERLNFMVPSKEQLKTKKEIDIFDKYSTYFIAKSKDKILASLRLINDSPIRLPVERVFKLNNLREQGKVCETSRWIAEPFSPRGVASKLYLAAYEYSIKNNIRFWVGGADENDITLDFYRRMGYKKLSDWKDYSINGIKRKGCLVVLDLKNLGPWWSDKVLI